MTRPAPATLPELLARWRTRDERYGRRRHYLDEASIKMVRAWRTEEAGGLDAEDWRLAMYELRRSW